MKLVPSPSISLARMKPRSVVGIEPRIRRQNPIEHQDSNWRSQSALVHRVSEQRRLRTHENTCTSPLVDEPRLPLR
jgi:hypothetical protein